MVAGTRSGSFRRWDLQGEVLSDRPQPQNDVAADPAPRQPGADHDFNTASQPSIESPDKSYVLEIDADRHARLHDAATGKTVGPALGGNHACCLAFSPDNARMATACYDGKIDLWEVWWPIEGLPERVR
ncbi:MAG TPA: hypothetical protein VFI31_28680, partial [Pirellulales bacterium]|nr:hypothetical protein [Pirellulales bacterium]